VEITGLCGGLVINIGTLNQRTIPVMLAAGKRANELRHPVVLDPVGAGASALRTDTALRLLEELKLTDYQLILLDVMLPDGDGFALFEQIRRIRGSRLPVIFLSARDEDQARLRGLGLGADDYVTKPFCRRSRLRRILRRTRLPRRARRRPDLRGRALRSGLFGPYAFRAEPLGARPSAVRRPLGY